MAHKNGKNREKLVLSPEKQAKNPLFRGFLGKKPCHEMRKNPKSVEVGRKFGKELG